MKIFFSDEQIIKYLKRKGYIIQKAENRLKSIEKARKVRSNEIRKKIISVVKELKEKGEVINAYKISKLANVNYRTAVKYLKEIENV